jgi:hypothetical protein
VGLPEEGIQAITANEVRKYLECSALLLAFQMFVDHSPVNVFEPPAKERPHYFMIPPKSLVTVIKVYRRLNINPPHKFQETLPEGAFRVEVEHGFTVAIAK